MLSDVSMFYIFGRFYNNEELSDITLKLGTQRYHAHRFVLVLMSDVFRTLCSQR